MVTGFVNGIFTVGMMMPDLIRKKFKLTVFWPVTDLILFVCVLALDFLQEHNIGIYLTQCIFHFMQHKATITGAESLVHVVGENFDGCFGHGVCM